MTPIVMIEKHFRYIEAGDPPMKAAMKGAEQIGFTIHFAHRLADCGFDSAAVHGRRCRPAVP